MPGLVPASFYTFLDLVNCSVLTGILSSTNAQNDLYANLQIVLVLNIFAECRRSIYFSLLPDPEAASGRTKSLARLANLY